MSIEEQEAIKQQIEAGLTESLEVLTPILGEMSKKDGIEKLVGIHNSIVPEVTSAICIKHGLLDLGMNDKIAPAMFDVFLQAAALGYVQGLKDGEQKENQHEQGE